ncbi:short-chain dehydrogenase, teichoic and lipoteichoic acid D-alanine esterification [Herbaspirillum sp. CF444]|uniref:SDR family oxidoreductase n=1 Tax=Herbaspirillum sp. CF444 TaxID=1144319 RepID=UPI0002725876|nr:SDR family NAD(P)-dependent oxidoreductase [Herbaspirillum sp. CF444]EJL80874.1 short-chain dehydrogenase, teichoic and lipoteichoic acid D-alanine esterification [Herbaspirillum sp. CF444]
MKLKNKTILITGGSSGIGLELARRLIALGNTVIITGRDSEKLHAAKRVLPQVHAIQSDVSDAGAIAALHAQVTAQFPALNVLINNAGIMRNLDLNDTRHGVADITREIDINLSGPLRMVQQFLPHLKAQKDAAIINVSSGLAFVPFASSPVYSATKAALHSYSQALRVQLRGSSVAVIELAPPGTETPLFRDEFKEEVKDMKAMDVKVLAEHAIKGIEAGKLEIRPGLSNVLKLMSRLAPEFMLNQLAKSFRPSRM